MASRIPPAFLANIKKGKGDKPAPPYKAGSGKKCPKCGQTMPMKGH